MNTITDFSKPIKNDILGPQVILGPQGVENNT